ncbi:putative integrase (plasmid) [Aromatoleum aromaticum EbN1]|uniref:Integrase n=1 Tax=Aromatoleum aromaticum (strain DSM 19018 / LMG 30748 / EbN1) TaxID=76114 RepID=Q5NWD1_AROAE|nr:tyrosine-type recombinase/integrase [Aromatoleum aromaticum]CAI10633.1 putative integrase [Aromatoleum aromaticum EbN1]
MSRRRCLQARIDDYLAERRRQGFHLRSRYAFLSSFARFVEAKRHRGPLTAELMIEWVRAGKDGHGDEGTWARSWGRLRHFNYYLQQFEPDTEVPEASLFGPEPGRVAPHIYRDDEIDDLLAAARTLGPSGSLRPFTYETLFGLMASTGLRVSEAIHLRDADVDLKRGMLMIRQTKFAKSRQLPIHPSTVKALARYRKQRERHLPTTTGMPFLIGSRGRRLGLPLGERQAHRVFTGLRDGLGWVNRGGHEAPRLHDLRHTFAVRRLVPWYADGAEVDQKMLALSTYMGHAEIFYTYWYLTAVPELVAIAAARFEQFADLAGDDDA